MGIFFGKEKIEDVVLAEEVGHSLMEGGLLGYFE